MSDATAAALAQLARRPRGSLLEPIVLAVTLALIVLFAFTTPGFATLGNLSVILSNSTSLVLLSCGMAVVVISRGLDLSQVAAMVAGATTYCTLINAGLPGPLALILAVLAMAAVGFVNGWLIAFVEIPALLATLASAMLVTGFFRFAVLRGEYLLILPKSNPAILFFKSDILPGLTAPVALMIATLIADLAPAALHHDRAHRLRDGRQFPGRPPRRSAGPHNDDLCLHLLRADRALAGLVIAAASGTVDFRIVTNGSLLFEVILVVVLGGIPLSGGRGGVRNLLVGAALIAVLRNGMTLFDFSTQTQDVLRGVVLVAAIFVDNYLNPRDAETDTVGDL